MAEIISFADRAVMMHAAAAHIADALKSGLAARGEACAALSGGSTPEPAYEGLAAMALDWSRIKFALVDERFVPPDHPASNEGLLRRALAPALARGAMLEPMYAPDALTAEAAADQADGAYRALAMDIAVMGMGADGHTASWFPGASGLETAMDSDSARAVVTLSAPGATGSAQRLTLTRAVLKRTRQVLLLITGTEKRAAFDRALIDRLAPVAALFSDSAKQSAVFWSP